MIEIMRLQPFTIADLQYVKLIKPFEDANLVVELPSDQKNEMLFVLDVCTDKHQSHYRFNHFLINGGHSETPTTLYTHLQARDEAIPTLCWYRVDGNRKYDIRAIKDYHELQALLSYATEEGLVKPRLTAGGKLQ